MAKDPLRPLLQRLMARRLETAKLDLAFYRESWPLLVGEQLAGRTSPVEVRGSVLVVAVPSNVWLQEATLRKEAMLQRVASWIPGRVSDMLFVLGERRTVASSSAPQAPAPVGALTAEDEAILAEVEDDELRALMARVRRLARGRDA